MQWTEKLANIADTETKSFATEIEGSESYERNVAKHSDTKIRFEGPYFTPALPQQYDAVICIVAGTGISGALAIAAAFAAQWHDIDDPGAGVGDSTEAEPQKRQPSDEDNRTNTAVSIRWRRLSIWWSVRSEDYIELPFDSLRTRPGLELQPYLTGAGQQRMDVVAKIREFKSTVMDPNRKTWAYISGPNGFISAAENACKQEGISHYGARWEI